MMPRDGYRVVMFVLNDMRLDSRVRREAAALASAGYDVTVHAVMSAATAHLGWEPVDGYTIVRTPMLMRPGTEMPRASTGARMSIGHRAMAAAFVTTRPVLGGALHFAANWRLRWHAWARRVEGQVIPAHVWHAHDFNTLGLAVACARRYGGRVVYDSHEVFTEAGATSLLPLPMRAMLRRIERRWATRADAVMTVNQSVRSVLEMTIGRDDISVLHNCAVPLADGATSPLRAAVGIDDATPLVLYHGAVTHGRGLEPLVAALADPRLRDTHLAIMGYGPLRPRIQALAAVSPAADRISLLPPVTPAQLIRWVSGADVAAMAIEPTTLNHRLSSPNKLFEAIAAGVPVVGPDFAEFRRIVAAPGRGPLGVLHADHRPASIASAIAEVLSLPLRARAELRERCRQAAADRWNWGIESGVLLSTYATLLEQPISEPVPTMRPARVAAFSPPAASAREH